MTEQIYTDKEILADALTAEKAATNNYNAFANECVHDSVRDAILHCLEHARCASAAAMPTAIPMPAPNGPVVASTPTVWPYSG